MWVSKKEAEQQKKDIETAFEYAHEIEATLEVKEAKIRSQAGKQAALQRKINELEKELLTKNMLVIDQQGRSSKR